MPEDIDWALNMAIIATNAEKEERALGKEDRGTAAQVFTVGGSSNITPLDRYERYERPRGKTQFSRARDGGSQHRTGPTQHSRRVDGTYSSRTDSGTAARFENERVIGARLQVRRTMMIVARHVDHTAFSVIIAGWQDIFVVIVFEGKREI
jgi:hypothetical protein